MLRRDYLGHRRPRPSSFLLPPVQAANAQDDNDDDCDDDLSNFRFNLQNRVDQFRQHTEQQRRQSKTTPHRQQISASFEHKRHNLLSNETNMDQSWNKSVDVALLRNQLLGQSNWAQLPHRPSPPSSATTTTLPISRREDDLEEEQTSNLSTTAARSTSDQETTLSTINLETKFERLTMSKFKSFSNSGNEYSNKRTFKPTLSNFDQVKILDSEPVLNKDVDQSFTKSSLKHVHDSIQHQGTDDKLRHVEQDQQDQFSVHDIDSNEAINSLHGSNGAKLGIDDQFQLSEQNIDSESISKIDPQDSLDELVESNIVDVNVENILNQIETSLYEHQKTITKHLENNLVELKNNLNFKQHNENIGNLRKDNDSFNIDTSMKETMAKSSHNFIHERMGLGCKTLSFKQFQKNQIWMVNVGFDNWWKWTEQIDDDLDDEIDDCDKQDGQNNSEEQTNNH
ncbi:hypothetical protein OIO90_005815 [Microbotryomycetes sp. JL221]|nr:hypothetical protein OIO90_005815 [Microbotryomycetes sp. JL221]